MKYLIAGLGNIGSEYAHTRHNIGFDVVEYLSNKFEGQFTTQRYGDISTIKHKGRTIILLKPSTYMNLSGKAVSYWLTAEKLSLENLMVITDDLALPFGKIRIRPSGSDGGHNGLKSLNEVLKNPNFCRLRFGIGSNFAKGFQSDYVLGKWNKDEEIEVQKRIEIAAEAILSFCTQGLGPTMTHFNKS